MMGVLQRVLIVESSPADVAELAKLLVSCFKAPDCRGLDYLKHSVLPNRQVRECTNGVVGLIVCAASSCSVLYYITDVTMLCLPCCECLAAGFHRSCADVRRASTAAREDSV